MFFIAASGRDPFYGHFNNLCAAVQQINRSIDFINIFRGGGPWLRGVHEIYTMFEKAWCGHLWSKETHFQLFSTQENLFYGRKQTVFRGRHLLLVANFQQISNIQVSKASDAQLTRFGIIFAVHSEILPNSIHFVSVSPDVWLSFPLLFPVSFLFHIGSSNGCVGS